MNKPTLTAESHTKARVAAALFMLAIAWGIGIDRLDGRALVPASVLWLVALAAGVATTVLALAMTGVLRRSVSATDALLVVVLAFGYCAAAFGTLAVFLFLLLNSALAVAPAQQLTLPIDTVGFTHSRLGDDPYVVVAFEGQAQRIAIERKSAAMAANCLHLTLQKGRFGYWVIRERDTSILCGTK